MCVSTSSIGGLRRLGSAAEMTANSRQGRASISRAARAAEAAQSTMSACAALSIKASKVVLARKTWSVDHQGCRQAFVREPVGGNAGSRRHDARPRLRRRLQAR